ncbi:hypothetical protein ACFO5R_04820 [Halosolutus amylolyticus]|uniref:Uncharacterized protein n=1 Tax=Halosolutus amylolyticus TaxID=2932267 RepID=A0ABD5PMW8_9EURY|nr:hypothetical protein [Halosolutus amylolyticus]
MIDRLYETIGHVPRINWLVMGIGVFLLSVAGWYLHTELRAIAVRESSPATFEHNPLVLRAFDRAIVWIAIVAFLLFGSFFLYRGYVTI